MEQKSTIHENQRPAFTASPFWPAPLFMNPMAMDPIGWSNDLFDITHKNMSQMFDAFLDNWLTLHSQALSASHLLSVSIPPKNAQQNEEPTVQAQPEKEPVAAPVTTMKNDGHRKEKQHP